ncbi:MAG: DUF1593 domain-containing protein [Faecalicoccus sp.]|nr:DUF1593 domain-containing protein [Faecalicoccus sp.]
MKRKGRTVITTDGEVDDQNSLIRALLYSNDMDIAGIVMTSSMYHYAGNETVPPYRWTGTKWVYDLLDAYEKDYDNLVCHDSNYPAPEYLRSVTKIGNISNQGEMEEITEGSIFLEQLFLDEDPRTLYVQTWGGTNTTARALKSIEEKWKDTDKWDVIQSKINEKVVIYIILDQDASYQDYIAVHWPDIKVINDTSNFWHFAYAWQFHSDEMNRTLKGDWCYKNLVDNDSALMSHYALMGDGKMVEGELYEEQRGTEDYLKANPNYSRYDFISEGDSPSFFYLIDVGLRSLEDPSFGGWGGRFGKISNRLYKNTVLDYDLYSKQFEAQYSLSRWFDAIQNDFACRVKWTLTKEDKKEYHAPVLKVREGLNLQADIGDVIDLHVDVLNKEKEDCCFKWWRYFEADTYGNIDLDTEVIKAGDLQLNIVGKPNQEVLDPIKIDGADTPHMSFTIPMDVQKGDTIHMIIEVSTKDEIPLTRYQRVIIEIN